MNDELAPLNDRVADLQGLRESERADADALKSMRQAPRQVEPDLGTSLAARARTTSCPRASRASAS